MSCQRLFVVPLASSLMLVGQKAFFWTVELIKFEITYFFKLIIVLQIL